MITLALTTWNRDSMTFDSFKQVLEDPRISEIVIVDDCSDERIYANLALMVKDIDKVKLYRNERNLDCYRNKKRAVELATNEWVILFDSDNILTPKYLDAINHNPADSRVLLQPSYAIPHFDFRKFQNQAITRHNVKNYINDSTFQTMLNAMNYYVNRNEYLMIWDGHVDPVTSDSLFHNYNWLKGGNTIFVTEGMEYEHRIHSGSHYQNNVQRTPRGFHDEILNKLRQL